MKVQKITMIIILIACMLTVLGVMYGQQIAVFEKAARICMECVGIG